jgi:hypothetical protein
MLDFGVDALRFARVHEGRAKLPEGEEGVS